MKRFAWFFILFLTFAGLAFAKPAFAQTQTTSGFKYNPNPIPQEHAKIVNDAAVKGVTNAEIYGSSQDTVTLNDLTCKMSVCDADNPNGVYGANNSAIVAIGSGVTAMYANPPADLALWIQDTGQTLGFIPKQAYAQGIGFTGLSALLPLWKVFRNIAYFLLAAVMIVIGFMVMFRKKIDPKTVVTVQNTIPKIVLSLLLITFSYAIVGLMIDLMYLMIFLLVGIFQSAKLLPDPSAIVKTIYPTNQLLYSQGGIIANMTNIFGLPIPGNPGGNSSPMTLIYQALGFDPKAATIVSTGSLILGIGLGAITQGWGLLAALPAGLSVVFAFLFSIALLFLVIRLFIFFLSAYIQILLALIFAPIQLVFEAMPGSTAFSDWMKNLFANLIVFPIGAGAFMLASVFANMASNPNAQLWSPPLTSLVPSSTRSISAMIAMGILFIIPTVAGGIKESLKAKAAVPVGIGGIAGPIGQAGGIGMQVFQFYHAIEQTQLLKKAYGGSGGGSSKE